MNEAWMKLLWFIGGITFAFASVIFINQWNKFIKQKNPFKERQIIALSSGVEPRRKKRKYTTSSQKNKDVNK